MLLRALARNRAASEDDLAHVARSRRWDVRALAASTARQAPLTGGGGTDMRVGISMAMRARPKPDLIVVITDGETRWPATPPTARVVVALVHTDESAPTTPDWATTVRVDLDDTPEPQPRDSISWAAR